MPKTEKPDFTTLVLVPSDGEPNERSRLVSTPHLTFLKASADLRGLRFDQIVITRGVEVTEALMASLWPCLKPHGGISDLNRMTR